MALQNTAYFQLGDGKTGEPLIRAQAAPAAYAASATLTPADLAGDLITINNAGATALTLPLATDLEAALPNFPVNGSFDFSVVSIGAGTSTVTTNTGWTLVGAMAVATGIAIRYRARKTATGAWSLYQTC